MNTMSLAVRNLSRQKKRSFLLGGAIAFGFCIVILIDGLSAGVLQNMADKFVSLFGAHIIVQGAQKDAYGKTLGVMNDDAFLKKALDSSGIRYTSTGKRSSLYGTLIFEGKKVTMNVFGCNIGQEDLLRRDMPLVSGTWENMQRENGIILSQPIAEELGIEVGDSIVLQTTTITGQQNVGDFVVAGIGREDNVLNNMAAYANLSYVNSLIGLKPDEFQMFNILIPDQARQETDALVLEAEIGKSAPVTSRAEAVRTNPTNPFMAITDQMKDTDYDGTKYAVLALNDSMPQIKQMLAAVQAITFVILIVLFLIIMVGISNTFRMILFERIRETGTMRAVGMTRKDAKMLFVQEAVILAAAGAAAGFIAALIIMSLLTLTTVNMPELTLFLKDGHYSYSLSPFSVILKFVIIIVLTAIAVRGSSQKAARMNPADALRTVK